MGIKKKIIKKKRSGLKVRLALVMLLAHRSVPPAPSAPCLLLPSSTSPGGRLLSSFLLLPPTWSTFISPLNSTSSGRVALFCRVSERLFGDFLALFGLNNFRLQWSNFVLVIVRKKKERKYIYLYIYIFSPMFTASS